jgi:hypothetical protein
MAGPDESGEYAPDSTDFYDDRLLDPTYNTDGKAGQLSPVWGYSERLREILDRNGQPKGRDRSELADALLRQLSTLGLYYEIVREFGASATPTETPRSIGLYVLLFPGEGKDNTGIKDLNDKILGYALNNQFIADRQKAVGEVFWQSETTLGPKFITVGADYKTAYVLAVDRTREDFAAALVTFDAKLVASLLPLLDAAEQEFKDDQKRVKAIRDVRNAISKNGYRFDFLYGVRLIDTGNRERLSSAKALVRTFLLITEALKGAGVVRLLGKYKKSYKKKVQKRIGLKPDPEKYDARGKGYEWRDFVRSAKNSGDIKEQIVTGKAGSVTVDFMNVYVNDVWTVAFFQSRRNVWVANPDVVRDVRKKLLEEPPLGKGYKIWFETQKYLLELWLVSLNIIDFVKDFLRKEFDKELLGYHDDCLAAFKEVKSETPTNDVKWSRLTRVLTRDLRNTSYPFPVLGSASEFQFFSYSSDHRARIFLSMDIRDLGVDLAFLYDYVLGELEMGRKKDVALMQTAFAATDVVNWLRREMFDAVRKAFLTYYGKLKGAANTRSAREAFGNADVADGLPSSFEDSLQLLMGGDEVFAAADPLYSAHLLEIIAALDAATLQGRPMNIRFGVAYSQAKRGPGQKRRNQESHDQAFRLSAGAAGSLKHWERMHRRIERYIEKLEDNEAKKKYAPGFAKSLDALGLMKMFARTQYGDTRVITGPELIERLARWSTDNFWESPKRSDPELVDFKGNIIDAKKLKKDVAQLEKDVAAKVGKDNVHVDPPPIMKEPAWVGKIHKWLEKYYEEMAKA